MKKCILILIMFLFAFCLAQEKIIFKKEPMQKVIISDKQKVLPKIKKPEKTIKIERPKLKESKES